MPEFLDGPQLSRRLNNALKNASEARLAVAFWGEGAADALGVRKGSKTRLKIICNLKSGGTNPDEIRTLQKRGAEILQLNDLHAKIGVIDNFSFLGSSNMSANGLGSEGSNAGWREANIFYKSARLEISRNFEELWSKASKITETDLMVATLLWNERQRGNALNAARIHRGGIIAFLRKFPKHLDALNVRLVVYDTITDKADLLTFSHYDKLTENNYGLTCVTYWDWPSLKTEALTAYLIDFDCPAPRRIRNGKIYYRDATRFPDVVGKEGEFHVAHPVESIEGLRLSRADKDAIDYAFHNYVDAGHKGESRDRMQYNILLSELVQYLPPVP